MTQRLEKLMPKIREPFMRSFLSAVNDRDSTAGHYTAPTLEVLAEKWLALEQEVEKCRDRHSKATM